MSHQAPRRRLFVLLLLLFLLLHFPNSVVEAKYNASRPIIISTKADPEYHVEFPAAESFYVEIKQDGYELLGLHVVATLQRPNRETPLQLLMRDDGKLADKSPNDGIYSARFVDYTSEGRYAYKFKVQGQGWILETDINKTTETPHFVRMKSFITREAFGKGFTLTAPPRVHVVRDIDKMIPPMQIVDLETVGVSRRFRRILLRWTAVGANLDSAAKKVSKYEITMETKKNPGGEWSNASTLIIDDPSKILAAGQPQIYEIAASWIMASGEGAKLEMFRFKISAFNDKGIRGKPSFPATTCAFGDGLDIFHIDVMALSVLPDVSKSNDTTVTMNVTWGVQRMDLIEFDRQNQTLIQFEILVGKLLWPMYAGLADYTIIHEFNISEVKNLSMDSFNFSRVVTIPMEGPQEWHVSVRGKAHTKYFSPTHSPLQDILVGFTTTPATATRTTVPATITTNTTSSTISPSLHAEGPPWWIYLIMAKVALLSVISLLCWWKHKQRRVDQFVLRRSHKKVCESKV